MTSATGAGSGAEAWLFPDLKVNRLGVRTQKWSEWFGGYLRGPAGIQDTRVGFDSFRHAFKVACSAAHVLEEVHDALTGHAGGSVGCSYGSADWTTPCGRL